MEQTPREPAAEPVKNPVPSKRAGLFTRAAFILLSAFIILHRAYLVYLIAALGGSQKPGALDGLGMSLMFLDPVAALPIILIGAVTGIANMPVDAFYRHYYQPASIGLDCFLIYLLWLWARGAFRGREEEKKEEKNMGDSGGI